MCRRFDSVPGHHLLQPPRSLTVLPATLSWLGDRVDRGRVPLVSRLRRDDGQGRIWGAIVAAVEYTTGRTAEIVGKPQPQLFRTALDRLGDALNATRDRPDRFMKALIRM